MGRNKVLSDENKKIIKEGYKNKLSCAEIMKQMKETMPKVKKHHIWAYAYNEGLTTPLKPVKRTKVKEGFFDIDKYAKENATA